jgi:hypothetical protein
MKKVLIIDDNSEVWNDRAELYEVYGLEIHLTSISDVTFERSFFSNFNAVLVHESGNGQSSFLEAALNSTYYGTFEQPINITLINNNPEITLDKLKARWQKFESSFRVTGFLRLPVRPKVLLSTIKTAEDAVGSYSWLDKLAIPARIVDVSTGALIPNTKWPWPANIPTVEKDLQQGSITPALGPEFGHDSPTMYQIVSSEVEENKFLQTAFPMELPRPGLDQVYEIIMRLFALLEFKRVRIYLLRGIPGGGASLELVAVQGHTMPSKSRVREMQVKLPDCFAMSENNNLTIRLDRQGQQLIANVAKKNRDGFGFGESQRALASGSNRNIRELHKLMNIRLGTQAAYVPFFDVNGNVRGIIGADNGDEKLSQFSVHNLQRNHSVLRSHLEHLCNSIQKEQRFEQLDRIQKLRTEFQQDQSNVDRNAFVTFARKVLRASFEVYPVSLAALAWKNTEKGSPHIMAIELDDSRYDAEEVRRLKSIENTVASPETVPAIFASSASQRDVFMLSGPSEGESPKDLNGNRPRIAFPLRIGNQVRGIVGFSVPKKHSKLFANDVAQLKAIWLEATPTLYFLEQIRSYSDKVDITRHDLLHAIKAIAELSTHVEDELLRETIQDELQDLAGAEALLEIGSTTSYAGELFNPICTVLEVAKIQKKLALRKQKRLVLDMQIDGFKVWGNSDVYKSVVRNLVKNAIDHGDRVGFPDTIPITVSMRRSEEKFELSVLNPGRLIQPPERADGAYRKGSQKAIVLISKMVAPFGATVSINEIDIEGSPHVRAAVVWPLTGEVQQ